MSRERARLLLSRFEQAVRSAHPPASPRNGAPAEPDVWLELLESMLLARHLDVLAHDLKAAGHGHYTICSSGHEANVVLGRLTTPNDPAIVHYRSAAFQVERARHVQGVDPVLDIALSLVASAEDPIAGGRHKVFGSKRLGIIPQTSTIASHLPRAVGLAFALCHPALPGAVPRDAIALVSFGDASLNHSTAQGALNAASWARHQHLRLPLLFVCEDNGLGISVPTPKNWVETRLGATPHVQYFGADGSDLFATWEAAQRAVNYCRTLRAPAALHLRTVRLLGHAGSDVDTAYRSSTEIEAALERDPVLCAALQLIEAGMATPDDLLALDQSARARARAAADRAVAAPKLESRAEILSALPPLPAPASVVVEPRQAPDDLSTGDLTLAQGINEALARALSDHPDVLVFGEDVAHKGGVYGVTKGLQKTVGRTRVFDTLLDEQTILGLALGAATLGLLPVAEIQYLAYLHNAEDQLRGEAATLPFFSRGAYDNPMVVRVAGFAYQKGFGGHFHNDNAVAVLRDVPGLIVGVPARADDALAMFDTAWLLARDQRRVVVIIEPIALYHERDLEDGDGGWLAGEPDAPAPFGRVRVYDTPSADLVIASYGNGLRLSLRAASRLARDHGLRTRVLDLRWLSPLPTAELLRHGAQVGRLLVVDECRKTASVSEEIAAAVLDAELPLRFARVTAADSLVPLGAAAQHVLVSEEEIVRAAQMLAQC